jgi:hypothetical protein
VLGSNYSVEDPGARDNFDLSLSLCKGDNDMRK